MRSVRDVRTSYASCCPRYEGHSVTPLRTLLILDTECSGLSPETDRIIEIGCVLYSLEQRCILSTWSELILGDTNAAYEVNRIPVEALTHGARLNDALASLESYASRADALVAHNAQFDRGFLEAAGFRTTLPWICTCHDIDWPRASSSQSLVAIALAHDLPVVSAHRALSDCLLLSKLLERTAELGADLDALLQRSLRPKELFVANVSYEDRHLAKRARFQWDSIVSGQWARNMPPEDTAALPFPALAMTGAKAATKVTMAQSAHEALLAFHAGQVPDAPWDTVLVSLGMLEMAQAGLALSELGKSYLKIHLPGGGPS